MKLNEIRDNPGARTPRKRVGRGIGSGLGKTAGKGHKGQKARSGSGPRIGFEGGQMPLYRRLPKRGFKKPNRRAFSEVNIGMVQQALDAGKLDASAVVDEAAIVASGLARRRQDGIRLLGKGTLSKGIQIQVTGASKAAIAAVEKAGGSVVLAGGSKVESKAEPSDAVPADEGKADGAAPGRGTEN